MLKIEEVCKKMKKGSNNCEILGHCFINWLDCLIKEDMNHCAKSWKSKQKTENVCKKLIKYAKSWESLQKAWESDKKYAKVWNSMRKYDKVW